MAVFEFAVKSNSGAVKPVSLSLCTTSLRPWILEQGPSKLFTERLNDVRAQTVLAKANRFQVVLGCLERLATFDIQMLT
jgi:hypothetical protein